MRLRCYHCNRQVEIELDQLEQTVECPVCGRTFDSDSGQDDTESRGSLFRWMSGSMSAIASGLIHGILLLLFGLWHFGVIRFTPPPVEVEVVPPSDEEVVTTPEEIVFVETDTTELRTSGTTSLDVGVATEIGGNPDFAGIPAEEFEIGNIAGGMGSLDLSPSVGLGHEVSFLGVAADGRYMCIVADCSGSMRGAKLTELKRQFRNTLRDMGGKKVCKILFFESRARPYLQAKWRNPQKDRAGIEAFLTGISAGGGTDPTDALEMVFQAERVPDVMWLMTDGEFNSGAGDVAAKIRQLNSDRRTKIHTISFQHDNHAELKQIADENNGKYEQY